MNEQALKLLIMKGLRGEATTEDLIDMRLAVRQLPITDVHNSLSGALEDSAAAKFSDDIEGNRT